MDTMAIKKKILELFNGRQGDFGERKYDGGWSFYLILAAVATTFSCSLPFGYHIGVVNTPAPYIQSFCNESIASRYNVTLSKSSMNVLWSSVVSVYVVGGCAGSVLGATLANRLGRKKATIVTSLLFMVGSVMFSVCRAANSVELLVLGRLVVGLAGGLTLSIVPMYLSELAPARLSGPMGVVCSLGCNVGVLTGQLMGLNFLLGAPSDWPYLLAMAGALAAGCLPLVCLLPESPKYLYVVRGDEPRALRELSKLRGLPTSALSEDVALLREESGLDAGDKEVGLGGNGEGPGGSGEGLGGKTERWGMWRVATAPALRLPLLLVCASQAGQQTSGINAVFYYSAAIFKSTGLPDESAQLATIGCGVVNCCTAVLIIFLLRRYGRRPLLLLSMASAVLLLAALAVCMVFLDVVSWMPYACVLAVLAYVLVYGLGLGPIPFFVASELFEVSTRGAGMSWGSLANWAGNFLVSMTFPILNMYIGAYCFLIFAALTALCCLFYWFYFPETKDKSASQVAALCSRGFASRPLRGPSDL